MANPHDRFFKYVLGQPAVAARALSLLLPGPLASALDLETLRLVPGSFVDERLRARHSDLLYEAHLAGKPCLLYLLLEHQRTPDRWMALRLLRYVTRAWDAWRTRRPRDRRLPAILSFVLYNGRQPWGEPTALSELVDLPEAAVPLVHTAELQFRLIDLSAVPDALLRGAALAGLALLLMKHIDQDDLPARLREWRGLVRQVLQAEDGWQSIVAAVHYLVGASECADDQLIAELVALDDNLEEPMATVAEQLMAKGRRQGRIAMLRAQITQRFGALSPEHQALFDAADESTLDRWAARILSASSVDELFSD